MFPRGILKAMLGPEQRLIPAILAAEAAGGLALVVAFDASWLAMTFRVIAVTGAGIFAVFTPFCTVLCIRGLSQEAVAAWAGGLSAHQRLALQRAGVKTGARRLRRGVAALFFAAFALPSILGALVGVALFRQL